LYNISGQQKIKTIPNNKRIL